LLLSSFSSEDRDTFAKRLNELRAHDRPGKRSYEIRDNVILLFSQTPLLEWSVPEIKSALDQEGAEVDLKVLYNVINYLATSGRLRRVSRGKYVINGLGASLDIDNVRNDGTMRTTEHDF
jgi:hypothetical protein